MSPASAASPPALELKGLSKTYKVHERTEKGVMAAMRSLFRRQWRDVEAVKNLTFTVEPGEIVGFLGPNGAGKTTTTKMLAGLLHPTDGDVRVLGFEPSRREKAFLQEITLIMGRRNQLVWDVPAVESFEFFRAVYGISDAEFDRRLDELVELMDLEPLLHKPVRNLSMGERMKCELTGALLHRPSVLFLDEPTIGLDVLAQDRFRAFIAEYNRRHDATVLLTSHYMGDVEELCERVIFINEGELLYDGSLKGLTERFLPYKTVEIHVADQDAELARYGEIVSRTNGRVRLRIPSQDTANVVARILSEQEVFNLDIEAPPATELVRHIYRQQETA